MRAADFPRVVREDEEDLWTMARTARYLGVTTRTVRRWTEAERDALPCLRLGAPNPASTRPRPIVRFRPSDVRRWASERRADG